MSDIIQESLDRFYFRHGSCCAGCDWWRHYNSVAGDCTKSAPVDAQTRWAMTQIENSSYAPGAGHVVTLRDHVCGDFKDDFDWSSLPLPYRARVGAPPRPNTRPIPTAPREGPQMAHRPPIDILPIQIRKDVTVQIAGIPHDLTREEADKIARVVMAMVKPEVAER